MQFSKISSNGTSEITLSGKITFMDHMGFAEIMKYIDEPGIKEIIINVKGVEFADSAALGSLLILHDKAQEHGIDCIIKHPQGQMKKLLEISRFNEIFSIIPLENSV